MKKHDLSSLQLPVLAGEPLDEPTARWVGGCARRRDRRQLLADRDRLADPLGAAGRRGHAAQVRQPVVSGATATTCALLHEGTGEEVGDGREGVLDDRAAAAAGLHDDGLGRRRALRQHLLLDLPDKLAYSTFDWATRDADGYYFVLGRTDDVINVAGHRLGTREIEEAVQAHSGIAEVRGRRRCRSAEGPDAARVRGGQGPVVGRDAAQRSRECAEEVHGRPSTASSAPSRGRVRCTSSRCCRRRARASSLRRAIQALAEGRDPGDLTTIEDPGALEQIRQALGDPLGLARNVVLPWPRGGPRSAIIAR